MTTKVSSRPVKFLMATFRASRLLLADAGSSLLGRPWHAIGMMTGILLGVASATAAIVIADTQEAQVGLRFDLQRSSHVVVRADTPSAAGFPAAQVALVAALEPVSAVGEFSTWSDQEPVSRSLASTTLSAPLVVADPGGLRASGTSVVAGATPDLLADVAPVPIAWVGQRLADELHVRPADGAPGTEAQVVVAGHPLSVAGIIANSAGFTYVESSIVVSRPVALRALGGQGTNVRLIAHVRPGSARAVAQYAVRTLDPAGGLALVDQTPADGERLLGSVGGDLRRVGTALGLIVGLVGMVAVSNTLMMAVHHRLRELGLRSAIGWSRRRIALLVLTEAGMAGAAAGVIGAGAGLGAAAAWCWGQEWTLVFPSLLPVVVTAAAIGASVVGGVIPALRAASISPFTAMRS